MAEALGAPETSITAAKPGPPQTIYFGNGCFWGRQVSLWMSFWMVTKYTVYSQNQAGSVFVQYE